MRLVRDFLAFSFGVLVVLLVAVNVYSHGGGLDAYGCHNDRKAGVYHCHRGQFAGQFFASKAEMLKKLSTAQLDNDTQAKAKQ